MNAPARYPFLSGGGEAAEIIAGFDWAATPLGPIELWPTSLKSALALILRSPVPIVILWGEDGIMLYNDAYSVFAGGRHPVSVRLQGPGRLARGRRVQRQRHEGRPCGRDAGL